MLGKSDIYRLSKLTLSGRHLSMKQIAKLCGVSKSYAHILKLSKKQNKKEFSNEEVLEIVRRTGKFDGRNSKHTGSNQSIKE